MAELLATRPIVLGIVGDSGAGKTTLAKGVAQIIGRDRVAFVCVDDYHSFSRAERLERGLAAADPEANFLSIAEQDLDLLRRGKPILKPEYDHTAGERRPPVYVEPKPYIIADGLLAFATERLRDCYDVKVFLEPNPELRVRWKTGRDTVLRGYTESEVRNTIHMASVAAARFVEPQRAYADIVIGFHPPEDDNTETGSGLNARHILRPTLPHPPLAPLLQSAPSDGLSLELSRDHDGKPVDILEVRGDIAAETAGRLEEFLWDLVPETSTIHENIGLYADARDQAVSHTLALTQLLMAYYLEHAAISRRSAI